jgi:hypothetical protein
MTIAEQTINWLFEDQLRVDDEWSIRTAKGFTWWADKHAQTIEVLGEEQGPEGEHAYLISVKTDFLRDLELNDQAALQVNLLMSFASMCGAVYEADTGNLRLCSLVRVHREISQWMNPLISLAAVLQIAQARIEGPGVAQMLNADEATSGHPTHGIRPEPDEMADTVEALIAPLGQQPCKWPHSEFQDAVDQYMQQPPSLLASNGGLTFTVEFPYGEHSSLCKVTGHDSHPRYGNGLLLLQSFPFTKRTEAEGARLALSLNAEELARKPYGYGFGSYVYRDGMIHFTSFFPNAAYRKGLLPNLYSSSAARALAMSVRLMNQGWDGATFSPRRSAVGRILDLLKGR